MTRFRLLLLSFLLAVASLPTAAQTPEEIPTGPEIQYSNRHQRYVLGGLTVTGVKNFDEELLKHISGLTVGETYEVPGQDITEAVRRYWSQKLFSNVQIFADSIVGEKIYLQVKLTAQPRISSINYSGVKKSEREDCEKLIGLQVGNQITVDLMNRAEYYIKKHFEEKGFKNCDVNISMREDVTGDNRVLVDININKNEKLSLIHI